MRPDDTRMPGDMAQHRTGALIVVIPVRIDFVNQSGFVMADEVVDDLACGLAGIVPAFEG